MKKKMMKEKGIERFQAKIKVYEHYKKKYSKNHNNASLTLAFNAMDDAITILRLLNEIELISDEEYYNLYDQYAEYSNE